MGICQADKGFKFRRIDIKVYPRSQYGYAILYFTGSAQFNKNMRTNALQHGFSLSDAGIVKLDEALKADRDQRLVRSLSELAKRKGETSEQDIFRAFGMKNYKPNERDM